MREMAGEHNTATFIPVPIELFSAFLKKDDNVPGRQQG
jgi:hypothetical protein